MSTGKVLAAFAWLARNFVHQARRIDAVNMELGPMD
jgi:hypothetical protein